MSKHAILRSGYISLVSDSLTKPDDNTNLFFSNVLSKQTGSVNTSYFYNGEVDFIYDQFCRKTEMNLNDIDTQAKIIRVAKKAFGEIELKDWICLQLESPYINNNHLLFIKDTLCFIETGVRSLPPLQWLSIVENTHGKHITNRENNKTFINDLMKYNYLLSQSMGTIVYKWVTINQTGWEDFIISLVVIFGDRKFYPFD